MHPASAADRPAASLRFSLNPADAPPRNSSPADRGRPETLFLPPGFLFPLLAYESVYTLLATIHNHE